MVDGFEVQGIDLDGDLMWSVECGIWDEVIRYLEACAPGPGAGLVGLLVIPKPDSSWNAEQECPAFGPWRLVPVTECKDCRAKKEGS
jgi:hypothetical protein